MHQVVELLLDRAILIVFFAILAAAIFSAEKKPKGGD